MGPLSLLLTAAVSSFLQIICHCSGKVRTHMSRVRAPSWVIPLRLRCPSSSNFISALPLIIVISFQIMCQPVLTQLSSLTASSGSSARLTSILNSNFIVAGYHISWYQQKTGSASQFLLIYSASIKNQGFGVPSHFSRSKHASHNAGLLHIFGLQPEDEPDCH
jgi:hypothetical protein